MVEVGVREAKAQLSELLRRVAAGEEVVIKRRNEPVARLVAVHPRAAKRILGTERGKIVASDDFDAPLPDDLLGLFYESKLVPGVERVAILTADPAFKRYDCDVVQVGMP